MADASKILLTEGDAPATPAAGIAALYTKTDHKFYTKGSDGVEQSAGTGTVTASGTPADNEYAKWTSATDVEGRTYAEVRTDLNVADGANAYTHPNHSGEVTSVADGAQTIAANAVTLAKLATQAAETVLANATSGAAVPTAVALSAQTVLGMLTGGHTKALSVAELLALVFSAAMTENVNIELAEAPSVDGKWTGIIETGVAGATLAFGDLVYLQTSDHRWELASSDNAAAGHNLKLGICILAAANDGSATKVLLYGKVRADTAFPDLTLGAPVYMGLTAGDIQVAAPTQTTDVVRKVGYGDEQKDTLFFCPSTDFIELV